MHLSTYGANCTDDGASNKNTTDDAMMYDTTRKLNFAYVVKKPRAPYIPFLDYYYLLHTSKYLKCFKCRATYVEVVVN